MTGQRRGKGPGPLVSGPESEMPWLSRPNLIHPRRRHINAPLLRKSLLCYFRLNDFLSPLSTRGRPCPSRKRTLPSSPHTVSHGHLSHLSVSFTGTDARRGRGHVLHLSLGLREVQPRPRAGPLEDEPSRRVPHAVPGPEPVLPGIAEPLAS